MAQRKDGQDDKGKVLVLRMQSTRGSGELERSEPKHRGEPEYILLTKISTVQLSQALSASLRGTEESPTVEELTVKTADCHPFKVPATGTLAKVMYVRELEADRNSFEYK